MTTTISEANENSKSFLDSRSERALRFGIDCPDGIVWRQWHAGGEYLKKLVLKNTHDKLQVVQYKVPRLKATFFVDFPQPVTLSSGMAYELVIRFRPTELVEYNDCIEIEVKGRGSFMVSLSALTPYAKLRAPEKYDFAFCPVGALTTAQLCFSNIGTVPLQISWEVPPPFKLEPAEASIPVNGDFAASLSFVPNEACPVVGQAVCRNIDGTLLGVVKLSGIGKFCFLKADQTTLDFGAALTTHRQQKTIKLQNRSCVNAAFNIQPSERDVVNPFQFHPTKGIVPRDGELQLSVRYMPESTGAQYANDFILTTVGGNSITFRCSGSAIGPKVSLSVTVLDFGDVDLESAPRPEKILVMKNRSNLDVEYDFVGVSPGCAFSIAPISGRLGANKLQNITVRFNPTAPCNFFRRVHLLVKHGDEAPFVELLGTGFNAKARPAPFTHRHVRYYLARIANGLGRTTPDDIERLLKGIEDNNTLGVDENEVAAREALQASIRAADEALSGKTVPLQRVLNVDDEQLMPFMLDENSVMFKVGAQVDAQAVHVRNNTSAKATATWVIPSPGCHFTVSPITADIPAFSTIAFTVRLSPSAPVTTFGQYLECYVAYKSMRSFRLVSEQTFTPPQCLTLQCRSVVPLNDTSSTPQIAAPSHIAFPPSHQLDSVFQVVPLTNEGDTVVSFDVAIRTRADANSKSKYEDATGELQGEEDVGQAFSCFPMTGVVPPKSSALVLFRFTPSKAKRYTGIANVRFNESTIGMRAIRLRGEGYVPQLTLENSGVLMFRPTSVHGVTTRQYVVENPSLVPVAFTFDVPPQFAKVLSIHPTEASLRGGEKVSLECSFLPTTTRRYEMKIPITVRSLETSVSESKIQFCHAVGEGLLGVVAMEPLELNYGSVMVGAEVAKDIMLFNSSLCDVHYQLRYVVTSQVRSELEAPPLRFHPSKRGVLRARSHLAVPVSITLPYRGSLSYTIYVLTGGSAESLDVTSPSDEDIERLPHCKATITGGHPTLEITDVRSTYQSKSHLWKNLSVTQINHELRQPVLPRDVETSSFTFSAACESLPAFHCDIGADIVRTAPAKVLVRLDNKGHCPVTFRFWFPHESEVPKEPWHQDPDISPKDLEYADILDRRLFEVSPNSATIPTGGHVIVTLTYQHIKLGHHVLPVLMRLDQGKRILMHLSGRTLAESTGFLSFHHSMTHDFISVPIGDREPPLQYTELQNLSHQSVTYTLDESALDEIRASNYDFPIFQCLNPSGMIPPMSSLLLSWYFRPLECKNYTTTVKISVAGGEDYELTLNGKGYHPLRIKTDEVKRMHEKDFAPLPLLPTISHPSLPLRLSVDVLRFGVIPFHSLHRRTVTLTNSHPHDTFLFEWHSALQYGDQMLEVEPPRGRLLPGESVQLRITLFAGSTSHVIDHPIHCHVLNESLRERRMARREAREREAAMQLEQPSNPMEAANSTTGSSTDAQGKAIASARMLLAPRTRQPVSTIPAKYQSTDRLKHAIQQLTEAAVSEDVDEESDERIYVDVLPTVLEELIQARIVPIDSFVEIYGSEACRRHYFPTLRVYSSMPSEKVDAVEPHEMLLLKSVITELLQEVVHHPAVLDSYEDLSEDPVPYFCQMVQEAPASQQPEDEDAAASKPPTGEEQCLLEELVEALLFQIVSEGQTPNGVLEKVASHVSLKRPTIGRGGTMGSTKTTKATTGKTVDALHTTVQSM